MKRRPPVFLSFFKGLFVITTLFVAACSGSSFGGTAAPGGVTPPLNQQQMAASPGIPGLHPTPSAGASPTTPPGSTVTYPIADASKGMKCPEDQGFSCTVTLPIVTPSPSSSPSASPSGSGSPSPSPTPTPTPTPSPSPSGSASPSPHPSPTSTAAAVTLTIAGMPKDAPKMNDPDPKAVATVALVALRVTVNQDVTLTGNASADFTLPKEQIGGRKFAVQLYQESQGRRKTTDHFVGSYNQSKLDGTTLSFAMNAPPLEIKKDETWLFVLYGDELPSSPSPSPSASASSSASPSASPSAAASASASPNASPSASPSP